MPTPTTKPRNIRVHRVESFAAGALRVRLYCSVTRGKKYWEVRDHFGGRGHTHRRKFKVKARAQLYADERAAAMHNGEVARLKITEAEALEYRQAMKILAPTGKDLVKLAYEELDRWQIAQQMKLGEAPLIADVTAQFIAEKKRQGLSDYHIRDLDGRLSRFAADFKLPINRIGHRELADWLNGLRDERSKKPISARTWNNYRAALAALFQFAKDRKYLPSDWAELDAVVPIKLKLARPEIFSPDQLSALLSAASDELRPAIAISAFAGVRSDEVLRLRWEDIKWEDGYIFLTREITKTSRTRKAPLPDNLVEWLKPWRESIGKVCLYKNLSVGKTNVGRRVGIKWKRNALRKSFISYRLASGITVDRVAEEAGNSPSVIHQSYLDLTTAAQAAKWFSIYPRSVEQNVLPLKFR